MADNSRLFRYRGLAVLLLAGFAALVLGRVGWSTEIGTGVKTFSLPDMHGHERSLDEFADKQFIVVAFLGTECPLARLYAPRLQELCDEYARAESPLVGIDANQQDSLTEMVAFSQQYELKFPLLKDRDQSVADQFAAARNPQVFVLDPQRKIRYRGRIDDQYGLGSSSGYARAEVKFATWAERSMSCWPARMFRSRPRKPWAA